MARAVLLGCLLAMALAVGAEAQSVPQYKDYPAKPFKGARAAVDVSPPDAWNYRSVLRKGAKQPINFAGRYVFTSWGVGSGCETGAAIDVSTGRVTFFPYNACFWREKDPPFLVKTGSRLFISTGNLGEDGPRGAHFFDFTGREFRYLMTNPFEDDLPPMAKGPTIDQRPEAGEASSEGESSVLQSKKGELSASDPLNTIIEVVTLIRNGEMPSWSDPQFSVFVRPYITEDLLGTIQSGGERAVETGENVWDAEVFTGAAGIVRAKLFSASVASRSEEIATANVSIGTSDTEEEPTVGVKYEYDLILEKGQWKIDDIRILEEWAKDQKSLKETFAEVQRVARIEPAAGKHDLIDRRPLLDNPDAGDAFTLLLASLIDRWGYDGAEKFIPDHISYDLVKSTADLIINTSVVSQVFRDNKNSILLYNSISDIFFLVDISNEGEIKLGAASARSISKNIFMNKSEEKYFPTMIYERPYLFRSMVKHFAVIPDPSQIFAFNMHSEEESVLLQESIISAMKMIAWGSQDPCRESATKAINLYMEKNNTETIKYAGNYYISMGFTTPEERVMGFADEATSRVSGFIFYEKSDVTNCRPKAAIFSRF